jgi:hypothetical protein
MPSFSKDVDFDFEVFCATCGAGLCGNCTEGRTPGRSMPFISIEPCKTCLEKASDDAYDKGYEDGCKEEQQ